MSLLFNLRSLFGKYFETTKRNMSVSYDDVMDYLKKFPIPANDFERSSYQYKCYMHMYNLLYRFCFSVLSILFIPLYQYRFKRTKINSAQSFDAIFISDGISIETIPDSVRNRYPSIKVVKNAEFMMLTKEDIVFFNSYKYHFHPYFNFKFLIKLAMISYCIHAYNPKAIIIYSEASFVTSLMSKYCENYNIKYIGIMHGEREYSLKLPFFRCSEYYVWDNDYLNLLTDLRCDPSQFIIEIPYSVRMPNYRKNEVQEYDYTFYLQDETSDSISRLQEICKIMKNKGYSLCIRLHPRFLNIDCSELKRYATLQMPSNVSMEESFSKTKNVIAKFSTVLYQAWYLGIPIIMDDYTIPGLYESLESRHSVLLLKNHKKLSTVLEDMKYEKNN